MLNKKMKIETFKIGHLRDDEHFQFHTEFRNLVETQCVAYTHYPYLARHRVQSQCLVGADNQIAEQTHNDARLCPLSFGEGSGERLISHFSYIAESDMRLPHIKSLFDKYMMLYKQELDALKKVMQSTVTDNIKKADRQRDILFYGMVSSNELALNDFGLDEKIAASHLKIVFDTYNNITTKPLSEKTAAIRNMLHELGHRYAAEIVTVGLVNWFRQLEANNKMFSKFDENRCDENAHQAEMTFKEARTQIDAAYHSITQSIAERMTVTTIIEEGELYKNFIHRLNAMIGKYNKLINN